MGTRIRVGVVGVGVIAQVMHLNYLRELSDHYDIVALCDCSEVSGAAQARRYGVPIFCTDFDELLHAPIDAVLVLTSGSHARYAIDAAKAGKHVFVEKPMAFSVAEGIAMRDAARANNVTLMVGYPKRYDPAFVRFREAARVVAQPALFRVTTFEAPFLPEIQHYGLTPPHPLADDIRAALKADTERALIAAVGDVDPDIRTLYHTVLLDTLVHEINTVRGIYGEPTRLDWVDRTPGSLTVALKFADVPVLITWLDLQGGITRYGMEFAVFGPERRVTLSFPSPFHRSAPAVIESVDGTLGSPGYAVTQEIISYESGFRRELEVFAECVRSGTEPPTSADDALADLAICHAIVRYLREPTPIDQPSDVVSAANTANTGGIYP